MTFEPLVRELVPAPSVAHALGAFAGDGPALFDSAAGGPGARTGRFSFLTADTWLIHPVPVRDIVRRFTAAPRPDLPPFQGGAVGLWCYERGWEFERLPRPKRLEISGRGGPKWVTGNSRAFSQTAWWYEGVADWVLAWDHAAGRAWLICHGWRKTLGDRAKAGKRYNWVRRRLELGAPPPPEPDGSPFVPDLPAVPGYPGAFSPFTRDAYEAAVARVIEYVRAGDVFQVNLAQPLLIPRPAGEDWRPLYGELRAKNPAPFGTAFSRGSKATVLSASPERFLSVTPDAAGRLHAEARPIKGTRPRSVDPAADAAAAAALLASEKDRAENVMIVDLLRNDLSRVCDPGSVRVPGLCELESYASVHHLVSEVRGTLREGCDAWDLLEAAFPGGSITGAPKVRAMEIIRDLEPFARGPYCGSQFWVGFDGGMDSNILIRTVQPHPAGFAVAWVGGGVTAKSDPAAEYEETLHKAAATLRALGVPPEA